MRQLVVVALLLMSALSSSPVSAEPWQVSSAEPAEGRPLVVLAPRASPAATLVVAFQVGSVDDGIESGLTRLSQHMMISGGPQAHAFKRKVYAAGAELTLTTEVRQATFRLTAPRESFFGLARALLDMTLAPKLAESGIARCRRLTLNDELSAGSRADLISFIAASVVMTEGGEGGGDYSNDTYGEAQVVRELGFDEVEAHVTQKMTPANATVIVTGGFSQRRVSALLERYQGGTRRPFERPDVKRYLPLQLDRWAPREIHLQAQLIELNTPRKAAIAHLLAALLEDRLRSRLGREGVSYGVAAYVVRREWMDFVVVEVPVAGDVDGVVEGELKRLFAELAEGRFVPGEFERNKSFALARMDATDRDPTRLAGALLGSAPGSSWHSAEVREALAGLSQAALLGEARRWLAAPAGMNFLFGRTRAQARERRR